MSVASIRKRICVEPKFLNSNVKKHIYDKICDQMLDKCDQQHGYILEIHSDIKILSNIVSSAGVGVFFDVEFTATALKPEVGHKYDGEAVMIYAHSIFVVIGKIKVMIPVDKMNGYKYNKTKSCYTKNSKNIKVGDKVQISIDKISYDKQNFICIGSLKVL